MARIVPYDPTNLPSLCRDVSNVLRSGGIVAVPTESFYGLAVSPFDEPAVARLCRLKGRSPGKPILVLIGDRSQIGRLVDAVPPVAEVLMDRFWPGPLTIVLPARASLPDELTAGTGTVGVRLSACRPLRDLLHSVGPVTGTSANRETAVPACRPEEVQAELGDAIDVIVDAGPTPGGRPSTVIEAGADVRLVREGAVPWAELRRALLAYGFEVTNDCN